MTSCTNELLFILLSDNKQLWNWSTNKRWNRASQAVMFLRLLPKALERFNLSSALFDKAVPPRT